MRMWPRAESARMSRREKIESFIDLIFLMITFDIAMVLYSIGQIAYGSYSGGIAFWDIQIKWILRFFQFLGLI